MITAQSMIVNEAIDLGSESKSHSEKSAAFENRPLVLVISDASQEKNKNDQ